MNILMMKKDILNFYTTNRKDKYTPQNTIVLN